MFRDAIGGRFDSINIGGSPVEETCVPVTDKAMYAEAMKMECQAYMHALRRKYGYEPEGARFKITSNPHDFGCYYEVDCRYLENDERAAEYAFGCEGGVGFWSEVGMKVSHTTTNGVIELHVAIDPSWRPEQVPQGCDPERYQAMLDEQLAYWVERMENCRRAADPVAGTVGRDRQPALPAAAGFAGLAGL
jgi:hypothetical protein